MQCEREQGVTRVQVNANAVVRSREYATRVKRFVIARSAATWQSSDSAWFATLQESKPSKDTGCAPRMKRLLRFALNDELTKTLPDWIGLDWMGIRRAIGPMSGLLY